MEAYYSSRRKDRCSRIKAAIILELALLFAVGFIYADGIWDSGNAIPAV